MNKATGLIDSGSSLRTYKYEAVLGAADETAVYPSYYMLPEERLGVVKDQGYVGACFAEVCASIAEVMNGIETGEFEEFSEGWAYGMFRDDISKSPGLLSRQALNYWRKIGIVPKKYFDELTEMPDMRKLVLKYPKLLKVAEKYKIEGFVEISANHKTRDFELKEALTKYGYGLLGTSRDYFKEPHAIAIVGWNDETDSYIIKNSWGKTYGDNGKKEIPKKEINEIFLILDEVFKMKFTDVNEKDNSWSYKAIKNVVAAGIMKGVSETLFDPKKAFTREEAAVVIDRIMENIDERLEIFAEQIANIKNK